MGSNDTTLMFLAIGAIAYYLDLKGIVHLGLVDLLGRPGSVPAPAGDTAPDTAPLPPSAPAPPSGPAPAPTPTSGAIDENGMKLLYPTTGKKVAMKIGSAHRNGQRYNVNHTFQNYFMQGYFKTTSNQQVIEMKTDGPNHGGCFSLPKCMWYEPDLAMNGSSHLGAEFPHPTNHLISGVDFIKNLGVSLKPKWIGYAVVAYSNAAKARVIEQWCDPDPFDAAGKPKNGWVLCLRMIDTGKVFPKQYYPRSLPTSGRGLEAEIRMHAGAKTPGAEMKWCNVYEITPPN